MRHTKGPWRRHGELILSNVTDNEVAQVALKNEKHNGADAQLIATAPELLENFEKAIRLIEHIQTKHGLVYEVTIRDGYRLIAKAKGESK